MTSVLGFIIPFYPIFLLMILDFYISKDHMYFDLTSSESRPITFHLILLFWGMTDLKKLKPKFSLVLKRLNCVTPVKNLVIKRGVELGDA